jgi:malonyl-CoA O-methyltransferase
MHSDRSAAIARSFGTRAESYDAHAALQRAVAGRLADFLPDLARPRVLELGCGTGLFSRHLIARYPGGRFTFSDLSPAMVEQCRRTVAPAGEVRFARIDASRLNGEGEFDVIALSMTLHWLTDPRLTLEHLRGRLSPHGALLYATLGPDSFAEWRDALAREGLPSGLVETPLLPGIVAEERIVSEGGALAFLRGLKAIGGLTPRAGYPPLPAGALRRAMRALDARHGGRLTWHIVYGRLNSPS